MVVAAFFGQWDVRRMKTRVGDRDGTSGDALWSTGASLAKISASTLFGGRTRVLPRIAA